VVVSGSPQPRQSAFAGEIVDLAGAVGEIAEFDPNSVKIVTAFFAHCSGQGGRLYRRQ
jgi:hypothetical protein